jgi:hypothetical protein
MTRSRPKKTTQNRHPLNGVSGPRPLNFWTYHSHVTANYFIPSPDITRHSDIKCQDKLAVFILEGSYAREIKWGKGFQAHV